MATYALSLQIAIADSNRKSSTLLKAAFDNVSGVEKVFVFSNTDKVLNAFESRKVNALLVDIFSIGIPKGLKLIENVRMLYPDSPICLVGSSKSLAIMPKVPEEWKLRFGHYYKLTKDKPADTMQDDAQNMGYKLATYLLARKAKVKLKDLRSMISYASEILDTKRGRNKSIHTTFGQFEIKEKDNTCFVLMPFTEEWSNRIWRKVLRPFLNNKLNLKAKRADDLFGANLMTDIWKAICHSKYIIADITGKNSNVFYELGIAHSLGKKVILLSQSVDDIPFDLKIYRHILYKDHFDGYSKLRDGLRKIITSMQESS